MDHLTLKSMGLAQAIIKFATEYKTRATLENNLERKIHALYSGQSGMPAFVDDTFRLMRGQIFQGVYKAARKIWPNATERADNLRVADLGWVEDMTNDQLMHIVKLAGEIMEAAALGKPVDPFLSRVSLWGAKFDEAYNKGLLMLSAAEAVLEWRYGPTEHCTDCLALHGKIASAYHWRLSGYVPQGRMLECGGWRCQCQLRPLSKREVAQLKAEGWISQVPVV